MAEPTSSDIRVPAISISETDDYNGVKGRPSPSGLSLSNKFIRSLSGNPIEGRRGSSTSTATDPITQQIMDRKSIDHPNPQKLRGSLASPTSVTSATERPSIDSPTRQSIDPRGDDGASKEKEKRLSKPSFLSRLRAGGKKRDSIDLPPAVVDGPDEVAPRDEGADAAIFSQPIGYIPKFAEPPKYIKVRAKGKETRDFDRLFLAQELRGRTGVEIAQAGGHRINVETRMKHDNATWAMEFSQDGHFLAAGGQGHVVRVWAVIATEADRREEEAEEGAAAAGHGIKLSAPVFKSRPIQEYEGHTASILAVSWSKNNFLLSSSMDKTVRLWHVSRAECLCVFKHPDYVPAVQFHPQDDRFFLAGSLDSKLRLWSIPDKNVAYSTIVSDLITAVAFTPDGKTIMAGTLSGQCVFYDTEKLREQTRMHVRSTHGKNAKGSKITGIQAVNFPPNDPKGNVKLLITSNDSRVRVYNLRDKSLELKLKGNENATSQISAAFSDDGKHIICGSEDKKCYIWNMGRPDKDREKHPMEIFEAHNDVVTAAIMAPAATKQLLQASGDPVFEICNPPPVQLLSREETRSVTSSETPAPKAYENGGLQAGTGNEPETAPFTPVEPSSSFKARSAHPGGYIIITADTEGRVKCFRSDCAYKNRLKNIENWDNGSTFSKKVLQRSSSVATRASRSGNNWRNSTISIGGPSDRILSWRQSIDRSSLPPINTTMHNMSDFPRSPSLRMKRNNRSASPRKSVSGLGNITQGRRQSSFASFASRGESVIHQHPLSTTMNQALPATGSAGASAQSLHSNGSSGRTPSSTDRADTQANTKVLRPDEFSALGVPPRSGGGAAASARHRGHERTISETNDTGGEYTGGEESEGDDDAAQKCRQCGSDSFKAVKQGKGRASRVRLECASCGLPAD